MFSLRAPLKTGVLTACAAACLAVAAPAAAQDPTFETFRNVCIAGDGDAAKAASVVEGDGGWMTLDPAMFGSDAPFENLKAWMKPEGAGFNLVMTGDLSEPMDGMGGMEMNMAVCAVGAQPGDAAAVEAEVKRFTGASAPAPDMDTPEFRGYVVGIENGQPVPVDPNITTEGLGARMMTGEVRLLMVGDQGGVTMVMYMEPKVQ
ncbi:MAG: hypothetical protein K2X07_08000 [Caulobacteraceae bacterium]|nr:hypothetical protein [Caulobacteraceae bacterium]